ncbi:MAG: transporter associated domain-containing protein [Alcanivoracaceae bacterium]|jgi:magnesium and cobalt transporter|nr:transporter associated domain-containing protein [Alcanivoracaceae bacterium]
MPDEVPDSSAGRSWLDRISDFFGSSPTSREDLVELMRSARDREVVDSDTLGIVEGALEMADMKVRDVMIPRTQMVVIRASSEPREFLPSIIDCAHSRFPVIGDDPDEVLGILLAKDLLPLALDPARMDRFNIKDHLRQALIIPESKRLDSLLRDFRISRNHMAIVVNEYGGVAGLVTIEDVLEQIVGEIEDEHDIDEDDYLIKELGDGEFTIKALMPIEDFNEHFRSKLNEEEFDTIGGLVLQRFGRLPAREESVEFGGFRFTVLSADSRTIRLLHVTPVGSANDTEARNGDDRP